MKKLFFIAAILSFGCAYGQQDYFFDAQKYLEKKKKAVTKPVITIPQTSTAIDPQVLSDLPNGNKLQILPQDNMPCIVPDMSQYNMPVVKPVMPQYTIPNPVFPPATNKPVILTEKQLEQLAEKLKKQK